MASRVTWQAGSLVFILGGLFGKFGAFLAMIPDPIVAGILLIGLGRFYQVLSKVNHIFWQHQSNFFFICLFFILIDSSFIVIRNNVMLVLHLGMCFSIAITNLEHVDIHSGRNQVILGASVTSGVCFPMFLIDTPRAFNTGMNIAVFVYYF